MGSTLISLCSKHPKQLFYVAVVGPVTTSLLLVVEYRLRFASIVRRAVVPKQLQSDLERKHSNFGDSMETEIILLDGGVGHELKLRGVSDGTFVAGVLANENCSSDNVVEAIHRDYLAAGCVVITTNSFVSVSV